MVERAFGAEVAVPRQIVVVEELRVMNVMKRKAGRRVVPLLVEP